MHVLKFGGTSVASAKNIRLVYEIVLERTKENTPTAVIVSALGGVTSQLIECGRLAASGDDAYLAILKEIANRHIEATKELIHLKNQGKTLSELRIMLNELEDIFRGIYLIRELSPKTGDRIQGFGELLSSLIIHEYFIDRGITADLIDPFNFIITNDRYGRAQTDREKSYTNIRKQLKGRENVIVIPGFVAATEKGEPTTLGRGGSDFTASLVAAAVKTKQLEIWTDVDGMMTADPREVSSAYVIRELSYEEAMELTHFGAKVVYPPSILPVLEKKIPILIKNTFNKEDPGTLIKANPQQEADRLIRGLSCIKDIALINLTGSGMIGIPDFSSRFFRALSAARIHVIMITQASSEHTICVGIAREDIAATRELVEEEFQLELAAHRVDPLEIEDNLAIVALVGSNMKHQVGVSGRMFSTLGSNGVNIKAIAQGSSERNISVVIDSAEIKKTLNCLHESFFLSDKKKLNLFIIGVGNVGKAFLEQIRKQKKYLSKYHHVNMVVAAIANSKKMYFNENGVDLASWEKVLAEKGEKMKLSSFLETMDTLNLRNSIFIDNTADAEVASIYKEVLKMSISVVTPNKIACTQSIDSFIALKKISLRYKTKFLYETNVGAGLPVISTLSDLIKSGDEIHRIEAVLSGSLNFIFNHYNGTSTFASIVKQAMEEGYTEPDPRIDLSGVDVKRKILILIRESVVDMEMDDIKTVSFIPEKCMKTKDVKSFLQSLEEEEDHFKAMYQKAERGGKKLKYVASYNRGKAETGIRMIDGSHPFYHLEGKDNIVTFNTRRYPEQPLVIKGAGAGADVTASGIFADVMKIANS